MISRRDFLKGLTLTAAGLLVPEAVGKVFYSIPKVVTSQNLWGSTAGTSIFKGQEMSLGKMRILYDLCESDPKVLPLFWPEEWRKV